MSETSPILSLPYVQPSQAQKHVTHNEALRLLDAVVQLAVEDRDRIEAPDTPSLGQRHIVAPGAVGIWASQDNTIAVFEESGWFFVSPRAGWVAQIIAEGHGVIFDGTVWNLPATRLDNLPGVGINGSSDDTNRLAVSGTATLLNHDGAGHQVKVNKAQPGDTASLLFQTGFSGRAEMGLAGQDNWALKVSADGTSWTESLTIDAATGHASGAAVQTDKTDVTPGRLMRADFGYGPGNLLGTVGEVAGVPTGAVIESASNINGSYTRFADGLQICTQLLSVSDINLAVGALFRSPSVDWIFPAPFHGGLGSFGGVVDTSDAWIVRGSSSFSNAIAHVRAMRATAVTTATALRVFAIGRWF